jgi:glucosyl-dolichyl phosphate glucuronosyltransferase
MHTPHIEREPALQSSDVAGRDVSVAVCAYTLNRWASLVDAVASVLAQLRAGDECLVVIDHNEVLYDRAAAAFADRPGVTVVANAGPKGLSGARNTAIAFSRGSIVAFLDDDAVAREHWLDRMRGALADHDVYAVGSAALPRWPGAGRPNWFPPEFDWVVGCSYVGLPEAPTDVRNVIGAAMAFRREAFDLAGVFSTVVGRIGATPTGCEETELCIRLRKAKPGARVTYLPDIAVTHHVTPDRLSLSYFFRRCMGEGLSKARVSRLVGAEDGLASERTYVRSTLPRGLLRGVRRGLRGDLGGWSTATMIIAGTVVTGYAYLRGRLAGSDRQDALVREASTS